MTHGITWLKGPVVLNQARDVVSGYSFKCDGMGKEGKDQQRDLVLNSERMVVAGLGTKDVGSMTRVM